MRKHAIIFTAVLIVATGLVMALLLGGCRDRQPPGTSAPVHTEADGILDAETTGTDGEAAQQTTADGSETTRQTEPEASDSQSDTQRPTEEAVAPTTEQTQPEAGGSQPGTQPLPDGPQGSTGVEDNWGEDATEGTTGTTDPEETTQPDKELTDLTYSQYMALSAEDQERYYDAFESHDAFKAWYNAAKAAYEEDREAVVGGGSVNLEDYIGK